MFIIEERLKKDGFDFLIGIDEAGRGPLAGPVVASAVLVHTPQFDSKIADSKKLSPRLREIAFDEIKDRSYVGIGIIEPDVIDRENILNATFIAMNSALEDLLIRIPPEIKEFGFEQRVCLMIDGNRFNTSHPYHFETIINGDSLAFSIACASIIAKVTRDRIMLDYDRIYPQYGFKKHKGYPTKEHKKALKEFGPSSIHRRSFKY